ncbi:hypothetical protein [Nocardia asteroides]|uniref:AAA+ ATPase domain-containing protein n=2 Tax=Nocardia asteroides TaxID=1824 RepID=U5E2W1_NOCAS|nr:hypothetical protein [Nocardia asteroides]UGT46792.1 hypothetical protein LT345_19865 [Nocardia asteroides]GAD81472.1 hypothetical protein NCAST_01_00400 [Nocardia asteroides NBRC 15531]
MGDNDMANGGVDLSKTDSLSLRERSIPLPTSTDGYRKVLLLGTTGAGKTTVVRQLLGTNPRTEKFPSTSTAKTTVADMEVIVTDEPAFRAAVTFAPRDVIEGHLQENVVEATLAAYAGKDDAVVGRKLLDHVNQRFRFSYALGRIQAASADDVIDDEDEDDEDDLDPDDFGQIDEAATALALKSVVQSLRLMAEEYALESADATPPDEVAKYVERNADSDLPRNPRFTEIVNTLLAELMQRFEAIDIGELRYDSRGWPILWTLQSTDRAEFLTTITRFTGNNAKLFGRLLTPLVSAVRVSGPFVPKWAETRPRLVLIDGEGLGHAKSHASPLSTRISRQLDQVDAVLLVDNAQQPMQAAAAAALKSVAISGHSAKLHFLFTHFDQVKGDNLDTFTEREEHVRQSLHNVLSQLRAEGRQVNPALESAERVLQLRLEHGAFFVGGIHKQLKPTSNAGRRTIEELNKLLAHIHDPEIANRAGESRPVYRKAELFDGISAAVVEFRGKWQVLLKLKSHASVLPEHGSRIKALARRVANRWDNNEYDNLKPVAELRESLNEQVWNIVQNPQRWLGARPTPEERQVLIDNFMIAVTSRLTDLIESRIVEEPHAEWVEAYAMSGSGSVARRAHALDVRILERGAPMPVTGRAPESNGLLTAVARLIDAAAAEQGVVFE